MVDISNDNQIPLTDDDNDSVDENIKGSHNSVIIPLELVSSLGRYWNPPKNYRRSDYIYWVARLNDCLEGN